MPQSEPVWRVKRNPCPFYQSGSCVFNHKCNFIHDGDVPQRRPDMRTHVPVYRRTPENSVDSFSSSEEDQEEHVIDEHSAAAPSLVFSSIYGPRPNSVNRLQLANVDLPVSPESLPNTPPRTSRPTSHHSGFVSVTSPAPSRPLSSSLGIGIGGRTQGGLAEVFAAVANAQAQATVPPPTGGSLPSPLSLSPKSPPNDAQEIEIKQDNFTLEQFPFKLALSNQSSLLLNRTTRAAARADSRRASSLPQRSGSNSSSGSGKNGKQPTVVSAPDRFSISSDPRRAGNVSLERPGSHSRSISVSSVPEAEEEEDEEEADDECEDEEDEDEPHIVNDPPSLESLLPYPRDVSTEPSPDPTRQVFVPPAPGPPPVQPQGNVRAEESLQPRRPHGRNNSARHIEHELLLDELEERLGVEPRRRRAPSSAASEQPKTGTPAPEQPTRNATDGQAEVQRKTTLVKSGVDMDAARDMLSAMFAKRAVEQDIPGSPGSPPGASSDEHSFLPVDWDVGSLDFTRADSVAGPSEAEDDENAQIIHSTVYPQAHSNTPSSHSHSHSHHTDTETDTYSEFSSEEPTEDLSELINQSVVLTPVNVVLRREVGRETSLPSRAGSGSGFGTPRTATVTSVTRVGSIADASTPRNATLTGLEQGDVQSLGSPVSRRGSANLLQTGRSRAGSFALRFDVVSRPVSAFGSGSGSGSGFVRLDRVVSSSSRGSVGLALCKEGDEGEDGDEEDGSESEDEDESEGEDEEREMGGVEIGKVRSEDGVENQGDGPGAGSGAGPRSSLVASSYQSSRLGDLTLPSIEPEPLVSVKGVRLSECEAEALWELEEGQEGSEGRFEGPGEPEGGEGDEEPEEKGLGIGREGEAGEGTVGIMARDIREVAPQKSQATSQEHVGQEQERVEQELASEEPAGMDWEGEKEPEADEPSHALPERQGHLVEVVSRPELPEATRGVESQSSVSEEDELVGMDEPAPEHEADQVFAPERHSESRHSPLPVPSPLVEPSQPPGSSPGPGPSPALGDLAELGPPVELASSTELGHSPRLECSPELRAPLEPQRSQGSPEFSPEPPLDPQHVQELEHSRTPKFSPQLKRSSLSTNPPLPHFTPSPQLPPLPEEIFDDTGLLEHASSRNGESPMDSGSPERSPELQSFTPPESARTSLSEIPSLSELAPLATHSNTLPQNARTATLTSEPRTTSEPSKARPRSQLKPLRLSLMYGLKTPTPGAGFTPISANSTAPTPVPLTAIPSPTPTAMYPTPASAHPVRQITHTRSASHSVSSLHDADEPVRITTRDDTGHGSFRAENVAWFGSKPTLKRGSLSASMRNSIRQSVRGSERSPAAIKVEHSPPRHITTLLPEATAAPEDEDVRPLPSVWGDDDIEGSGSSRQGSRSIDDAADDSSRSVPVFEVAAAAPVPAEAQPPKTPDRLDTIPRYPAFVQMGPTSPRVSETRTPLASPSFVSTPTKPKRQSKASPTRGRKWADTVDQGSIGSLPTFDTPTPAGRSPDAQPTSAPNASPLGERPPEAPHTNGNHGPESTPRSDRLGYLRYMQIPNTAPLSISPRRVSPSIMQRAQEEGLDPFDDIYPDDMRMPLTAPLHLRMRMPKKEGSGPWLAEYFTNSPSSFHGSQPGSLHSASSSVSNGVKVVPPRQRTVAIKKVDVEAETFGNPGPGPSTMKTYSERRQSAEALKSPILLQPAFEREASPPKESQSPAPTERAMSKGTARQASAAIATPSKGEDKSKVKISPRELTAEAVPRTRSVGPSPPSQSPLRNELDEAPSMEVQRHMVGRSPSLSASPGMHPPTPLSAPSPLQILRRNMMTRTSPESPKFLSPQMRLASFSDSRPSRHQHHASLAPTPTTREEMRHIPTPMSAPGPRDRRSLTPGGQTTRTPSRPGSPAQSIQSTLSQTKPLLFFAIAKNSAQEVERLLQVGEAKPNDKAGPEDLPALAFALANEQLTDKTQIVKSLLSHGADPSSVLHRHSGSGQFDDADLALTSRIEQGINPAIRYYLNRKRMTIPAPQAELLEKNNFGGLTRAGFSIIGQDAALDELIRVVAGHCRRQTLNPLVIVFSGGPGCGKSLLASKIGPLLHVPSFTVNMTNLRNESALFNYISMTTKPGHPQIPLVDFLKHNEGQRCVIVLEEIEKAADKTVWHSLLMPWEWGKATVISPTTNEQIDIDTSKVIWIATSNSGDDATLKFFAERSRPSGGVGIDRGGESALARLTQGPRPNDNFTRKDYLQLMQAVRKRLGELLGSSIISRVSSVLPFLPFTGEEVYALASESLSAMRADQKGDQNVEDVDWEELLQQAVGEYIPGEGARSVHRAVQRAFDEITEW